MKYIKDNQKSSDCVFCANSRGKDDAKYHIFLRHRTCFAILNRYPYSNGHILVIPYRHVADLNDLEDEELLDLMQLVRRCKNLLHNRRTTP